MESNPHEIELNFGPGRDDQIEELENVRDELSEAMEFDENAPEEYSDEYYNDYDGAEDEENSGTAENIAPAAAPVPDTEILLRSRQPMNRPAGTPPLNSVSSIGTVSALEMAVAGKSYGTALRILREQRNMTYAELEQITRIQPRFIESLENEDPGDMSLTFVIGYIRTLLRVYGVQQKTSDELVAPLKKQLENPCPEGFITGLDVDDDGKEENDRRLKKIIWSFGAVVMAVLALIIMIVVMISSCSSSGEEAPESTGQQQKTDRSAFDPDSIKPLLKKPKFELQKLPLAE